jgi:hypothetical protein
LPPALFPVAILIAAASCRSYDNNGTSDAGHAMPIHDWTQVEAGIFHAFHHDWITEISRALNRGVLPPEYYALPEQITGGFGPDVLTLSTTPASPAPIGPTGGIAVEVAPPKVHLRMRAEAGRYAAKAKAIVIRHVSDHRIVAMLEIVSPGNKTSQNGLSAFVYKAREALSAGIHLLIVGLFPPGPRDPLGIHHAVWGDDCGKDYEPPLDKPLTCVAYIAGAGAEAFINFLQVHDPLPQMPLFLTSAVYVDVPLESTYRAAWESMPQYWQNILDAAPRP